MHSLTPSFRKIIGMKNRTIKDRRRKEKRKTKTRSKQKKIKRPKKKRRKHLTLPPWMTINLRMIGIG